jgi:hypothetical protein
MTRTILLELGPLILVPSKTEDGRDRVGLYLILVKDHKAKIGPYFADLSKAHEAMRKIVKKFPAEIWKQPVGWLSRQKDMLTWIDTEIGYSEDLVGGHWVDENGKIIINRR